MELTAGNSIYHDSAVKLTTGRACLAYILKILKPQKVYLPYYCCDALFEPMELMGIDYEFYTISEQLEIDKDYELKQGEYLIYCNFFGIKTNYTDGLVAQYGDKLIVDNTHAFFHKGFGDIYSFTSARKYFGVPDGAFLYGPDYPIATETIERNTSLSIIHNYHRLMGQQETAFKEFLEHEKSLGSEIERISLASELLLTNVDYKAVRERRKANFEFYRTELSGINTLQIEPSETEAFCYPLLLKQQIDRSILYPQQIYIPNYWMDTTLRADSGEYPFTDKLSRELLPLPLDHRYSQDDLQRVVRAIKSLIQ